MKMTLQQLKVKQLKFKPLQQLSTNKTGTYLRVSIDFSDLGRELSAGGGSGVVTDFSGDLSFAVIVFWNANDKYRMLDIMRGKFASEMNEN